MIPGRPADQHQNITGFPWLRGLPGTASQLGKETVSQMGVIWFYYINGVEQRQ